MSSEVQLEIASGISSDIAMRGQRLIREFLRIVSEIPVGDHLEILLEKSPGF